MGLRVKLLLVWFGLLLAPLIILGGVGYVYIDDQLRKDAVTSQTELTLTLADSVNRYFNILIEAADSASKNSEVISLLNPSSSVSSGSEITALSFLSSYSNLEEYQLIKKTDFSQPLVMKARNQSVKNQMTDLSSLANLAGDEVSVHHLLESNGGRRGSAIVLAPVKDSKNDSLILGYVALVAEVQPLTEIVSIQANILNRFFIVDSAGRLLTPLDDIELSALPMAELAKGDNENNNLVAENFDRGGNSYFLTLDKLNGGFWLASITDNGLILQRKMPYIIIFSMTLSLTLLLSGLVFNFIVNNIAIKPIQKLIYATRLIARGDFKPEITVKSKDELGELALAFRQMGKQLRQTSRRIRQLAYFDPLTQLPNRTTLRETLNRLLNQSERGQWKTAVLFIDLDDFKKVNDRLGHEAGDELLVQISERLKNRLRQADLLFEQSGVTSVDQLISRRGGDEFNAILTNLKAPHDAAIVAERIIQDLNEPFYISKSEIHVGASVGIAIFPDDGSDADTLLRNADLAMYEAKAKGKNNYHIFTSAINEQVHRRLALENALQVAMVQNQFRMFYQPKISLVDMRPVGFEALIRWQHPDKGMILPGKFIPVAEESNLIRDIGNWTLGESMQQIQLWESVLPDGVRIAVNISARQLSQTDLVDQLAMMMEHFSLSPRRLEIELTETSVLQDETLAIHHLHALRELGVEISLDDFGTGYSSLSFLRKLPIDTVKIDKSFTANVIHNSEARAIVVSLLNLCRELKVKTIAEGIETTEQLQFLMEHGCDQGQGFLFSKPLPSHEVMAFLEDPSYLAMS
ncbi:hypothetical protein NBRC116493_01330 [Aurantivibrio infirmus]